MDGCNGGLSSAAFEYLEKTGAELESAYPYKGKDGVCKAELHEQKVKVTTYANVKKRDAAALHAAIDKGPVAVAVEADKAPFQHYKSGILNSPLCGTNLDHAITAVGYGDGFYIVRNSWGSSWGEEGYVRISTKEGLLGAGMCGILK